MAEVDELAREAVVDAPPAAESNGHAAQESGSLMATLRAKREELGRDRRLDLDIPGYAGLLVARYKPVEWTAVSKISDRVNKSNSPRADVLGAADLLIACCDELMTRKDGELVPLNQAPALEPSVRQVLGEESVRYEKRLAEAFGYEASSAREAVFGLFRNDYAVIDQHRQVLEWLREAGEQVDQDF